MYSMWLKLVLVFCFVSSVKPHKKIRIMVKALEKEIQELKDGQALMTDVVEQLENNITMAGNGVGWPLQCNDTDVTSDEQVMRGISVETGHGFVERLGKLSKDLEVIRNYLTDEKRLDVEMRKRSEVIVKDMDTKVDEANVIVSGLREDVSRSLEKYQIMLEEVNATSRQIVGADDVVGVLNYGGIGTPCSEEICQTSSSECRDGRCQCIPGLSYDIRTGNCVDTCSFYGTTYQTVQHRFIRGYNNITIENATVSECRRQCEEARDFICRSLDYFPRWEHCFLSEVIVSEVPEEAWEYSTVGTYFQRDCGVE